MKENPITRDRKCPSCGSERVERRGSAQGGGWGAEGSYSQWEQYVCLECGKPFRLVLNKACPKCGTVVFVDDPFCEKCKAEVQFPVPE
jgi:DNA-directed RNA polymerase subunit RPC12/RpoP